MSEKKLTFELSKDDKSLKRIHEFNVKAFSDEDLNWTYDNLKNYISNDWIIYSANFDGDIVAAMSVKEQSGSLLTKNSSIGVDYQGNGFSHMIKDFFEDLAKSEGLSSVVNFCPFDNFRMISLNERHHYVKTGKTFGKNNEIIEWQKQL